MPHCKHDGARAQVRWVKKGTKRRYDGRKEGRKKEKQSQGKGNRTERNGME
jgi:hypothetical protein